MHSRCRALFCDRFQAAFRAYGVRCAEAPQNWHRPDVDEFTELQRLLQPHAESGDVHCQYALATILSLGLCCSSEKQFMNDHAAAIKEATRWWIAAAKQGFCPALDNLVTSGVGAEAEQARLAWRKLQHELPDLVKSWNGMPVYGPDFIEELSRRLYGRVLPDTA